VSRDFFELSLSGELAGCFLLFVVCSFCCVNLINTQVRGSTRYSVFFCSADRVKRCDGVFTCPCPRRHAPPFMTEQGLLRRAPRHYRRSLQQRMKRAQRLSSTAHASSPRRRTSRRSRNAGGGRRVQGGVVASEARRTRSELEVSRCSLPVLENHWSLYLTFLAFQIFLRFDCC